MSTPSTSPISNPNGNHPPTLVRDQEGAPALRPATEAPAPAPTKAKPNRARSVFLALIALAVVGGGVRYLMTAGHEGTDDAQVEGRIVSVAARVSGQVTKVLVQDNQLVKAGDVLVELDHAELDARLEVAKADLLSSQAQLSAAQAQLSLTERNSAANMKQARGGLTQASSTIESTKASLDQAKADVSAAEARFRLADVELQRVKSLRAQDAIAQAELDSKQAAYDQAKASLDQANARFSGTKASIAGASGGFASAEGRLAAADTGTQQISVSKAAVDLAAAKVKQSEAALHLAELNDSYAYVKASVDGVVSRRTVEVGQLVGPERALMALVPPKDIWVVANFKEDQIGEMKPGQPVHVSIDTYGGRSFQGHVDSIAGATGARFSLLPPDNASGNYVKVVQRVPVLIKFDGLGDMQLRPGLSAEVTVDTRK